MNTNIAHYPDGKWYVVRQMNIAGETFYYTLSQGYETSLEARTEQIEYVMGRKS